MNMDELIQLQVLKLKAAQSGISGRLLDHVLDQAETTQVRQMCAKVSPQLYDALEKVCEVLDLSKRAFIEAAVSDAVQRAEQQISTALSQERF